MVKKKLNKTEKLKSLKRSSSYRVAYKDRDFLASEFTRPARLQLELLKTEIAMRLNKIKSTIVVFGGTRIMEPSKARRRVKRIEKQLEKNPQDKRLRDKLKIAKAIVRRSRYYEEARRFGRMVSLDCLQPNGHEYVIVTGGGPGIMEAANRGAFDIGAKSIGLNITIPMEQEPNQYITDDLCFQFHYFAIRKMHFLLRAKALVAFPGGFGTLDEIFEALTLVQTQKIKSLPIILFGKEYWTRVINFDYLVKQGTIDKGDVDFFVYADKAEDAWDYIKNYNSD